MVDAKKRFSDLKVESRMRMISRRMFRPFSDRRIKTSVRRQESKRVSFARVSPARYVCTYVSSSRIAPAEDR